MIRLEKIRNKIWYERNQPIYQPEEFHDVGKSLEAVMANDLVIWRIFQWPWVTLKWPVILCHLEFGSFTNDQWHNDLCHLGHLELSGSFGHLVIWIRRNILMIYSTSWLTNIIIKKLLSNIKTFFFLTLFLS